MCGAEDFGAAAGRCLGGVHRHVRVAEQVVGSLARVAATEGDTDAGRDRRRGVTEMDRLAQGVGQADGDRERELLVAEIVEQHREFVAAEPRRHVGRAE